VAVEERWEVGKMMKIKIINDGNIYNTKVINEETGEMIPVTGFQIMASIKERCVRVVLDIPRVNLDISADLDEKNNP
jgi:hypothetical protein